MRDPSSRMQDHHELTTLCRPLTLNLPPVVQQAIADNLEPIDRASLKLVARGLGQWNQPALKLNTRLWGDFHLKVEKGFRVHKRKLPTLACMHCKKCKAPEAFAEFQQEKPLKKDQSGRSCTECMIRTGWARIEWHNFLVKEVMSFGCSGCFKAKPLTEEETSPEGSVEYYGLNPLESVKDVSVSGVHDWSNVKKGRWCKGCWEVLKNYHIIHRPEDDNQSPPSS